MKRLIAITLLLLAFDARADTCDLVVQQDAAATVQHLGHLSAKECFGEDEDADPLTKQILAEVARPLPKTRTIEEVAAFKADAKRQLEVIEASLSKATQGAPSRWNDPLAVVQSRLALAVSEVMSPDMRVTPSYWQYDDLSYFDSTLDLKPSIYAACTDPASASCATAKSTASAIVRHANLAYAVLNRVLTPRLREMFKEVAALDNQWDTYFEERRSQYVWELIFNSWRYRRALCRGLPPQECASKLAPPPDNQIIVLHPTAAVEYVRKGENDVNAVAIVELIGYNRWGIGGGRLSDVALGASITATVSLGSQGERLGWGAMVHINNAYSVGAARRDIGMGTETVWLISVDVGELITKVDGEARTAFRFGR